MQSPVDIEKDAVSQTRLRSNGDVPSTDGIRLANESQSNNLSIAQSEESPLVLGWRERLRYFTWTWFTLSMATGGIAAVIFNVPNSLRFPALFGIGCAFMFLNICLFIMNCIGISLRFYFWPETFRSSLLHPSESLFVPATVISLCIILTNVTQYGLTNGKTGIWLTNTLAILYWIYAGLAVTFSLGIYLLMWSTQTFSISQMTPIWIFPAYPLLLAGPFASVLSDPLTGRQGASALRIIISGVILQGIGFMVSLMVYSAYLYRLMTQKLPHESLRPAMFISVGPSGFTVAALIRLGSNFAQVIPAYDPNFMGNGDMAGAVSRILANWVGLWLWGLALWFFFVSVGAHWSSLKHPWNFAMTWNSYIFPNTALVMATFAVARALDNNRGIEILGCVMACLLVLAWGVIMTLAVRAVIKKQVLWPQKQDDKHDQHYMVRDLIGDKAEGSRAVAAPGPVATASKSKQTTSSEPRREVKLH